MIALSKGLQLTVTSATITPTHDIHHVTGTPVNGYVNISTINVPSPSFCGVLYLVGDNNLSFDNSGNIDFNGSISSKRVIAFYYDPDTSKWYPEGF